MLHSIVYDPQGIILVKFHGPLILAEVRQVMVEVGRLAREHQCFRVLSNTRQMELKLSMADIYYLPRMFTERLSAVGLQVHNFKRAVLASPDDRILQFFETISRNRAHDVKIFYDDEAARQWLLNA